MQQEMTLRALTVVFFFFFFFFNFASLLIHRRLTNLSVLQRENFRELITYESCHSYILF